MTCTVIRLDKIFLTRIKQMWKITHDSQHRPTIGDRLHFEKESEYLLSTNGMLIVALSAGFIGKQVDTDMDFILVGDYLIQSHKYAEVQYPAWRKIIPIDDEDGYKDFSSRVAFGVDSDWWIFHDICSDGHDFRPYLLKGLDRIANWTRWKYLENGNVIGMSNNRDFFTLASLR